ncbi:MAG: site-specific integrase [Pseudomonadota bacterium]
MNLFGLYSPPLAASSSFRRKPESRESKYPAACGGVFYWFNHQVQVRRTFNHGRPYEPKSTKSVRSIDLGPTVINELKKWKLACPKNELDLVFPNENGKPIDCNNMVKYHFHPALRRAGLRRIRFHDLRHTYTTLLIAQGEHPKYIQTQMGHSSIKVTMDTYGHLMESVNREASKRLEMTVFGENGDFLETKTSQGLTQMS